MDKITRNYFERHRIFTMILLYGGMVLFVEILLRLVNPSLLDFAHRFRQVNRYHPTWKVDAQPNAASFIRLEVSGNVDVLSFLVTINEYGFRSWDRPLDSRVTRSTPETRIVHAVGDSFVMGWGLNYEASYPAMLDFMLPEKVRVINLGVNGFGTIGATEKSISVWKHFPADVAVYLYIANDYENDVDAREHSKLPGFVHPLYDVWNWLRQNTYLANCPYALVYRFRFATNACPDDLSDRKIIFRDTSQDINVFSPAAAPSDPNKGEPSKTALRAYKKFLDERNVPLIVLTLGPHEHAQDFYRFCKEEGVEAHYFTTPDDLLLRQEGHFNQLGNYRVAQFVFKLINSKIMRNPGDMEVKVTATK